MGSELSAQDNSLSQLALPLQLADHAVFESFWPAGNEALVAFLEGLAEGQGEVGGWVWGPVASGKTHLLQAVCERLGDRAVYLPFATLLDAGPGILDGLAERGFVCIDDVGQAAGNAQWEHAFFDLCNQLSDRHGSLLVSAEAPVRECGFALPDLGSRLSRLPAFQLRPLEESQRIKALQLRSRHRGLELPNDAARFLLTRSRRDMGSLYRQLDRLDAAALRAKRRLTVPFIKDVLSRSEA